MSWNAELSELWAKGTFSCSVENCWSSSLAIWFFFFGGSPLSWELWAKASAAASTILFSALRNHDCWLLHQQQQLLALSGGWWVQEKTQREKGLVSADPQVGMDSSAALLSLPVCCGNKFPLFVSKLLEGVVLGIGGDTFLERHLERRNTNFIGWRCDSSRDAGSPQLHM